MHTLYLSLGSNLGDRRRLLDKAVRLIGERVGEIERVSQYVETEPWGFVSAFPFLNAAVRVRTSLAPLEVLSVTQGIERELGRTQKSVGGNYHDRPIDIDLLMMFDGQREVRVATNELTLPHPLMWQREFVIVPLREVL